jgi:hypothetical protein
LITLVKCCTYWWWKFNNIATNMWFYDGNQPPYQFDGAQRSAESWWTKVPPDSVENVPDTLMSGQREWILLTTIFSYFGWNQQTKTKLYHWTSDLKKIYF